MEKTSKNKLNCQQPATRWEDAFPLGNGHCGAMVYGNICHETILMNHEALWTRYDKQEPPDISDCLPELREMLANEEWAWADRFLNIMFLEKGFVPQNKDNYHPAFDLKIDMEPTAPFRNYKHELDLELGVDKVTWEEKDVKHTRESFFSRDNGIFFLKISNDENNVSCKCHLEARQLTEENAHAKNKLITWKDVGITFENTVSQEWNWIHGAYANGDQFGGVAKVIAPGGSIESTYQEIKASGASHVIIMVKIFAHEPKEEAIDKMMEELDTISANFKELRDKATKIHQNLYNRLEMDLGVPEQEREKSNELLLLESYSGNVNRVLIERMFNFGRYLLISSSRPGGWPANLQGVWNGYYFPPWSSDYHNDENIQMNYWAALPGNLAETTHPYFDLYEACLPDYRRNAKVLYGCRGVFAPIAQTIKGEAPLYGGPWLNWTAGAGWLSQLFFDYWLFTRKEAFLRERAIPFLKEITLFYEDFLFEGDDGKYVFSPSLSPENVPDVPNASLVAVNATMDVAVAKEVLTNLINGCEHLKIEHENVHKWKEMVEKLPEYEINNDGAIKEWIHPNLKDNYHHRHVSHIYGLFPGLEIIKETNPKFYEACRVAVEKRLVIGQESQSGWSLAHQTSIWARLLEGNRALACLETLIRSSVGTNLFTYHNDWRHMGLTLFWDFMERLFQIDANFGLTAGVLEMLLFSNKDFIKILPGRPSGWKQGSLKGALTRCGAAISFEWNVEKQFLRVEINPRITTKVTIRFPGVVNSIECDQDADLVSSSPLGDEYRIFSLLAKKKVVLIVGISFNS
ncbi:MAG: glycoside hydrolase N-terminal domain-containing protein [Candidatus Hodarchaeota archaeon]